MGPVNCSQNPQIDEKWLKSQKYTATVSPETRVVAEKKEKRKEKGENARRNKRNVYPIGY